MRIVFRKCFFSLLIFCIGMSMAFSATISQNKAVSSFADKAKAPSFLSDELRRDLIQKQLNLYQQAADQHWGNLSGYKWMDINAIEYAMTIGAEGNAVADRWAKETLEETVKLLDPIWGGMYLYATDSNWLHPNFEKILIIQAEDMRIYSQAYQYWHNPTYRLTAIKIADYINNFLTNSDGVFYAAQSAYRVAGKQDESYYKLSDKERRALGVPAIDKHIYTDANGATINSLTYLYIMTADPIYLSRAERAANWIVNHLSTSNGGFYHQLNDKHVFLNDNLAMSIAFLTLYKATANKTYLNKSLQTMDLLGINLKIAHQLP